MKGEKTLKLGDMPIDAKQIFWRMEHCYAIVPFLQLTQGHVILIPRRTVTAFTQLQANQLFDLTLTSKLLARALQNYLACSSTTLHLQSPPPSVPGHPLVMHILPRKPNDLKNEKKIEQMLGRYWQQANRQYAQKTTMNVNAYANKVLQGVNQQARKYESHVSMCFKQEQIF